MIAALLIDAEIERKGILPTDKKSIEKLMLQLINHQSHTKLSSEGIDLLNLYAAGGFNRIRENIDATSELEVFLIQFLRMMNE